MNMKDFSITIAGGERHDGEAPYTYVVSATDAADATRIALEWHRRNRDDDDLELVEVVECVPSMDCGYCWNDLRGKTEAKQRTLQEYDHGNGCD